MVVFNGFNLSDIKVKLKDSNHLSLASKKMTIIPIEGKEEALVIDTGTFNTKDRELTFIATWEEDVVELMIKTLREKLQVPRGYQNMTVGTFSYRGIVTDEIDIEQLSKRLYLIKIKFNLREV